LSFGPEDRIWGYDAAINAGRYPKSTFANTASFVGQKFNSDDLAALASEKFVMTDFVSDERGYVAYQTFSVENKDEKIIHYSEELVAMILSYGKMLAEKQADGGLVRDAVITVPSWFETKDRLLFMDAAEISGLRVI
jgi:heat shock protein 1/8